MGRAILVLGVPRSGTSAVAGVLHHLGVNMGTGHLQKANKWNPKGHMEDLRWQKLNKQLTGARYGHTQPETISQQQQDQYKALAEMCDVNFLWGMKDPRLCFTARHFWRYLDDARIIAVMRSPEAAATSLMRHSQENYRGQHGMTKHQATDLRDLWARAMEQRLIEFWGPVMRVQYEELIQWPDDTISDLARFAFHGIRELVPDFQAARQFVDPRLKHHA